jgi:hypothetical protein
MSAYDGDGGIPMALRMTLNYIFINPVVGMYNSDILYQRST